MKEKVVLFGASRLGKIAFRKLNKIYDVCFFVDNDVKKHNRQFCGRDVKGSEILLNKNNIFKIIITSCYDVSIAKQLIEMDIKKFGVFDLELKEVQFYDYTKITSNEKEKISLIMSNNSGSNTFALYKNIPESISKKYDVVLINLNAKGENYYFNLSQSKMVIRTHYDDFYYDESQINIQVWHGFPIKAMSYMSKTENKIGKEKRHVQWNKTRLIPSYSQTYSTLMNACYGIKDSKKYVVTGMPRNDLLFSLDSRLTLKKLLDKKIENKKVIFYMPTYRIAKHDEVNGSVEGFNLLNSEDVFLLDSFLREKNLILIVKLHPKHLDNLEIVNLINDTENILYLNDEQLFERNIDLYELLESVDLLITDYSSIYFDFLLLERPIIFTHLDLKEYEENRGFLLDPLDFWTPGPKVKNITDLLEEINRFLSDVTYYKKERRIIRDIAHTYKDDKSSERVWKLIDRLMEEQ